MDLSLTCRGYVDLLLPCIGHSEYMIIIHSTENTQTSQFYAEVYISIIAIISIYTIL